MQLSIDIERHKSTLFLDFLKLLKKDHMINDFSNVSSVINDMDNGMGNKKSLRINI